MPNLTWDINIESLQRLQKMWRFSIVGNDSHNNWDLVFTDLSYAVSFTDMFPVEASWFTFPDRVTKLRGQPVSVTIKGGSYPIDLS